MIILSDSNNNVVGSFIDSTIVTNLQGVTDLPAPPEQQVGVNAILKIDPTANALSYEYEAIGSTLAEVQASKISQIVSLYNKKLAEGFISSASEVSHVFGYGQTDREKFMQLAILVQSGKASFPVIVHTKDNTDVPYDQTQYGNLINDIAAFASQQDTKEHMYINQVNAATTIDGVNAIVVTF